MVFKPQKVDSSSWLYWLKKGFLLSNKRLVVGIFIGYCIATLGLSEISLAYLDTAVFFGLCLLVIVAKAADENRPFREKFQQIPFWVWIQLIMVYSACFLPIILIAKIAAALLVPDVSSDLPEPLPFGGASLLIASALFCVSGFVIWFLMPLLVAGQVPLQVAIIQAKDALMLNKFVFIFVFGIGASALTFASISPALSVLWFTFIPSVMYASYQHIWWEKGNIKPSLFQSNATNAPQFH